MGEFLVGDSTGCVVLVAKDGTWPRRWLLAAVLLRVVAVVATAATGGTGAWHEPHPRP